MANGTHALLANGTLAEGAISISLNDSWTGRKLLEALDMPPIRYSPEHMDVSDGAEANCGLLCIVFGLISFRGRGLAF